MKLLRTETSDDGKIVRVYQHDSLGVVETATERVGSAVLVRVDRFVRIPLLKRRSAAPRPRSKPGAA